ncbi:MAG: AraC family ligand binding domain-containing protein, partial [Clostridia bacterium]|nr:AraC family ligand binding domain-containing protein [Clostridia bacterium]
MLLKAERERYNRMPIVAWNFTFGDPDVEMPWPPLAIGQSLLRVYQPHIHDEIEIHQIRRGRVFAEICGQPLTLEPGDILIVNPWELHQGSIPDDIVTEYIHTTFLPDYFAGSCGAAGDVFRRLQAGELGFSNHLAADHPAAAEIGRTLDIIYAAYCAAASGEVAETAADCRLASAASAMMAALLTSVPL